MGSAMKDSFLQELLADSVIGDFNDFIIGMKFPDLDSPSITDVIYEWNCKMTEGLLATYDINGGVELVAGNYLFVIAPNPKQSTNKIRATHYYSGRGAICEAEYENEKNAIIDCVLTYPGALNIPGTLDSWMDDNVFTQSFVV